MNVLFTAIARPPILLRGMYVLAPPHVLLDRTSHRLRNLEHKRYFSVSTLTRGIFCLRGRVSLPKAAPDLCLIRAPFPEARG